MRKHPVLSLLCAVAVGLIVAACGDIYVGGPTTVQTNTQGGGGGSSASPAPGGGTITHVKVTQFGEDCPSGTSPSGADRSVRVGCTKNLTCTPFVGPNEPASPTIHGPAPDFFGVVNGGPAAQVTVPSEPFNRDVKGLSEGVVSFRCVVRGVQSEQFDLLVVR